MDPVYIKKQMYIYLAGYISGKKIEKCMEWRKEVRKHYDNWKGKERYPIIWLDPLNGEQFGKITSDGLKCDIPGKALVHRDYKCVSIADLLIVNMDTFGETRPLTGTIYELAWAWKNETPVIVITQDQNYKEHPFIKDTASIIVPSVKDMLDKKIINYFWKGLHSAQY